MLEKNFYAVNRDVKLLVSDAQELLVAAASLTGDKAEEMYQQGMVLMDAAINKAKESHANALSAGKEMAASTNHYVKENPWRSIATGAGIGLLLGVILGRR
ncbi:ElaB/YqjD/DUF883 family membrane-anchored ribosome-binding protein [Oxalobacteraceae bacterium GrIS 2.11]